MRIKSFQDTDTLYIEIRASAVAETRDLDKDATIDPDHEGTICAMTLEHAKDRADLSYFSFEQIGV